MNLRSTKARTLVALPAIALTVLGLAGCQTKVGAAAVVNGTKISEQTLNGYLTTHAKPISSSDGSSSTPPRQFVLTALVRSAVFLRLLEATGGAPDSGTMTQARASVLQGGSQQQLVQSVTSVGLDPSFADAYLTQQELLTVLEKRVQSDTDLAAAEKKADLHVSISPRYGSWDATTLSLNGLSKKQLAPLVSIDGSLPGDTGAGPTPSQ